MGRLDHLERSWRLAATQACTLAWAVDLTEGVLGGPPFAVGDLVRHPDGRQVRIVAGQYWGRHGLSNHWSWREVFADGQEGPLEHGYGWQPSPGP